MTELMINDEGHAASLQRFLLTLLFIQLIEKVAGFSLDQLDNVTSAFTLTADKRFLSSRLGSALTSINNLTWIFGAPDAPHCFKGSTKQLCILESKWGSFGGFTESPVGRTTTATASFFLDTTYNNYYGLSSSSSVGESLAGHNYTIAVGAPNSIGNGLSEAGAVLVYRLDAAGMSITETHRLFGDQVNAHSGTSLAVADVDHDRYTDVIVGTPNSQRVTVYFGPHYNTTANYTGPLDSMFGKTIAFVEACANQPAYLAIGAPSTIQNQAGTVYIFNAFARNIQYQTSNASTVVTGHGQKFGSALSAGDFYQNGCMALAVGDPSQSSAYVFKVPLQDLNQLNGENGFAVTNTNPQASDFGSAAALSPYGLAAFASPRGNASKLFDGIVYTIAHRPGVGANGIQSLSDSRYVATLEGTFLTLAGHALAFHQNLLLIGAPGYFGAGRVYGVPINFLMQLLNSLSPSPSISPSASISPLATDADSQADTTTTTIVGVSAAAFAAVCIGTATTAYLCKRQQRRHRTDLFRPTQQSKPLPIQAQQGTQTTAVKL